MGYLKKNTGRTVSSLNAATGVIEVQLVTQLAYSDNRSRSIPKTTGDEDRLTAAVRRERKKKV
jgi:hypothetical protein